MIDVYYWPTANGHKVTVFLEETGLPYTIKPVNIGAGDQFDEAFLRISPNNKIPAIVDHLPSAGGEPIAMFESGAILQYLALKTGRFLPQRVREQFDVLQWLYWQVGHLGPMLGQNHHFRRYAPENIAYAVERYEKETERLYGILDDQLEAREFIAGEYSIADMACYPWIRPDYQGMNLDDFANLKRWHTEIGNRAAVKRAYARAEEVKSGEVVPDASRKVLFGQGRREKG